MSKSKIKVTFGVIAGTIALTFAIMTATQLQSSGANSQTTTRIVGGTVAQKKDKPKKPAKPSKKPAKPSKKPAKPSKKPAKPSKTPTASIQTPKPLLNNTLSSSVPSALNSSGFDIFKIINTKEALGKNLMISPTSLYTALAMLINGADAKTLEEMRAVLKIGNMEISQFNDNMKNIVLSQNRNSNGVELSNANSLWINNKFKSKVLLPFQDTCKSFFNSEAKFFSNPNDFNLINAWCSDKTMGKIPEILSTPISQKNALFLLNALYMKGTWEKPFSASNNTIKFDTGSGVVDAKYMYDSRRSCEYLHLDSCDAIKLRYNVPGKNTEFSKVSMYVILPTKTTKIDNFINGFNLEMWNNIKSRLTMKKVNIQIPKFTLETSLNKLKEAYATMGMPSAFDESKANFKKIGDFSPAFVNIFKHKTFIDVNEKGTEAAAVTIIGVAHPVAAPKTETFIADRPFFYAIEDEMTTSILFMGKVVDPTKNKK